MTKSRNINAPRHHWTDEELTRLCDLYPSRHTAEAALILGVGLSVAHKKAKALGLVKTPEHLKTAAGRLDGVRGANTRFQPGQKPANPFKKGAHVSPATEFKKGQVSPNRQEVGALRINTLGDIDIKLAEGKNQWLSLRRYVWEMENGPIPADMCIAVLDGDPHNTQLENLKLVTRRENIQINLHRRYPKEIRNLMALGGRLKNKIKQTQEANHGN